MKQAVEEQIGQTILFTFTSYLIACVVSLFFLFYAMGQTTIDNLDADESFYYQQAVQLVEGKYEINDYRPIGFPLILASVLMISGGQLFKAKVILIMISSLRSPLLYLFAQEITGNRIVSFISSLISAIWPPLVYLSTTLYTESITPVFFLAFMIALPRKPSVWLRWALAGMILGMMILIHPMYCFFFPFLFLIQLLEGTLGWSLRNFLIVISSCLLLILPWSYSISKHEGQFLFVSMNSADALAGGLNEKLYSNNEYISFAPNGRKTSTGPGMWITDNGYLLPSEEQLSLKERNKLIYERTWEWITTNPYKALYLEGMKLLRLWGFYPYLPALKVRFIFGNIPILILLFLSVLALWKWRQYYRELCRLWLVPIFVSVVALYAIGSWRYRLPADLTLIILSTMYVYSCFSSGSLHIGKK